MLEIVKSKFELIPLGDVRWVASVMGLGAEHRDLHLDQRMLVPYVTAFKWDAYLAHTSNQNGYVIQPLLVTKDGQLRHAYNFGGPVASYPFANAQNHIDNVNEWARKQGLHSQYCTLIPFLAKEQKKLLSDTDIITEYKKESVIIDIHDQKIRGTTRRRANKAKEAGVKVNSYPLTSLSSFLEIYEATMDRNNAKEHWRFSPQWFESFARFLKPTLLLAEYEGKAEAGCLILYSQQYPVAYYHFAGTYNRHPKLGIMQLLVLSACEFAKAVGVRYLYLGGGRTDDPKDSLLEFKAGFSHLKLPVDVYNINYGDS